MRDLLVTTHTPVLRSGQAMRTYGIARALALGGDGLTLLYARFGAPAPDSAFASIPAVELHEVVASRGARRMAAYAAARLRGVPDGFARGISSELSAVATQLARESGRGRVIADGPIAAAALHRLARERPVIYNAHNLESAFRHELAPTRLGGLGGLRSFERRLLAHSQESWMVSEADMQAARELCPDARLRLAPNVVDVAAIAPVAEPSSEPRALFVANFSYEPNRNALAFLLDEVMGRVWERLPDAELALVGPGLERPPSRDPRVRPMGFVDDLAVAYRQARCVVVPLLQGGGSPLKLIEALAYGLPIVATSRAVAGIEAHDGEHLLVADGAEQFAAKLIRVLEQGAPELGTAARRLAQERYSIEALARLIRV